jgi:anhydro-N-acetylmuramic acid kinase
VNAGDRPLFVGVMSGTSLDGIDVVLAALPQAGPRVLHARTYPFAAELRAELAELCHARTVDLEAFGATDARLGETIGASINELLAEVGVSPTRIEAIGSHGQTVRHMPRRPPAPFTMQIGDPARIAEQTGITVVADFRRADVAAGGEGAPLVPAFHAAVFGADRPRAIVNIGGMANVTLLDGAGPGGSRTRTVTGFDTGPGNVLIDAWAECHLGEPRDLGGAWAAQGRIEEELLGMLLDDPWFTEPPPKSTGREHFDLAWLQARLTDSWAPAAVAATITELTARSIAAAIVDLADFPAEELLVCGGGRHNDYLMARLAAALPDVQVRSTDAVGVDGDWLEALAFAWLAQRRLGGRSGNVPAVTGAAGERVLGSVWAGAPTSPDQNRR